MQQFGAMVKKSRKKVTEIATHIYGIENIVLKDCIAIGTRNYDQQSSGRPESDVEFLTFWKISGMSRILSAATNIRAFPSTEESGISFSKLFM
ncbi:hypothetical protein TNCV_2652321 [Trichonephila clavipes]|nr:hypothetical protein TNCV_2652321 [Trichonephila clavipes]